MHFPCTYTAARVLSLALATGSTILANDLPQVAVLPFEAGSMQPTEVRIIEDALATEILSSGKARVMERAQMDKILGEQGFQNSGTCDQNECAVKMGQLLGIDKIVVGSMGKLGETWVLSSRLVDVASGEVIASSTRKKEGAIDDIISTTVPDLRQDLFGGKGRSRKGLWIWGTAGVAVVAGGATAAYLLLADDGAGANASPTPDAPDNKASDDVLVKWK